MEKAIICSYDYETGRDGTEKLTVQFNPESYSIRSGNRYGEETGGIGQQDAGSGYQFLTGQPAILSVELLFDTYRRNPPGGKNPDVRERFGLLRTFLRTEPEKHTPLPLKFSWGSLVFVGVVTQMQETYTMFSESGIPVRARLSLSIQGSRAEDLSKRATHSPDRTKLRTVVQRDTLWNLAEREYGSAEVWRVIARANGIENPRKLPQAQQLVLPALPGGKE